MLDCGTLDNDYNKKLMVDGFECNFCSITEFDYNAEECCQRMQDNLLSRYHGFILLYSIDDRRSFEEIFPFYEKILRVKDQNDARTIPIIVVGHKSDLNEKQRLVTWEEATKFTKSQKILYMEASSLQGINVTEVFSELAREIRRKHIEKENYHKPDGIRIKKDCLIC